MYYDLVTPLESIDSRNTGIRSPNLFSAFLPKGISLHRGARTVLLPGRLAFT